MSFLKLFRSSAKQNNNSAQTAKERLRVIVDYERQRRQLLPYLPKLQEEILAVIKKYVDIKQENVNVSFADQDGHSRLEVNVQFLD